MFKKMINSFAADMPEDVIAEHESRNQTRNESDFATVIINGREYSIRDWSTGGFYFTGADGSMNVGDTVDLTLKFDLPYNPVQFNHTGTIVRREYDGYAVELAPLNSETRKEFMRVMDAVIIMGFEDGIASYQ